MSNLTTYRASKLTLSDWRGIADNAGVSAAVMFYIVDEVRSTLTPDTRLQAIADAWNYDDIGQGRYEFRQQWSELAVLLDALKEDNDE